MVSVCEAHILNLASEMEVAIVKWLTLDRDPFIPYAPNYMLPAQPLLKSPVTFNAGTFYGGQLARKHGTCYHRCNHCDAPQLIYTSYSASVALLALLAPVWWGVPDFARMICMNYD